MFKFKIITGAYITLPHQWDDIEVLWKDKLGGHCMMRLKSGREFALDPQQYDDIMSELPNADIWEGFNED